MQDISNKNYPDHDSTIEIIEVFKVLWQSKLAIISFTSFISILTVVYSLYLPNIYKSTAILAPSESSSSISRALQSYSGLAGLAGISLSSGGDSNHATQALAKLTTFSFFEQNILPNIFLPDLMALASWDSKTKKLIYDENIYDIITNTWVGASSGSKNLIPSSQESFRIFSSHLQISEDRKTGFITIAIKHQSPFIAKEWLELTVNQINLYFREKERSESNRSIVYLNDQIAMTNLAEVKQAISQIIQNEIKKLAVIEVKQDYVFEYIDPPIVLEKKSEPKRSIICILGALFGAMLSSLVILIRYYIQSRRTS